MNLVCLHYLVLASWDDTTSVWGRFDGQHGGPLFGAREFTILSGVIAVAAVTFLWQWIDRRRPQDFRCNRPSRLFDELCKAHRLDRSSRRVLKQLAACRGLTDAGVLFIEPDHFDTSRIPAELTTSAKQIRQLRHQLFD